MTDYTLPEGMTAEWMREHADWLTASDDQATTRDVADDLRAWADAIDPPEPPSIVTDEMVEAYRQERRPTLDPAPKHDRRDLEAVERLGWLRDPNGIDWEEACSQAWSEIRRLRKRVHDLESGATDNPSPSVEPWPTDEQVEVAAIAIFGHASPKMSWSESIHQEVWRERARAALEAVAPPPTSAVVAVDDYWRRRYIDVVGEWDKALNRLEMAEGLLRQVLHLELTGDGLWWVPGSTAFVTADEAEYLDSLRDGEGDSDE